LLPAQSSYASFYTGSVDGVAGAWGMIIPNNLPNGIRRVEQRRFDNGERVDCGNTDGDGIWPSGANTVNPASGATAIHITSTDAAMQVSQAPTSVSASFTSICPGNSVTLTVAGGSLHQGGLWRWFTGDCGTASFNTGNSVTVSPTVTTTYWVRGETSCFQTSCASVTITVGNCPSNDLRPFATTVASNTFSTCTATAGNVTTASPSPEATSLLTTGEDVWYRFVANSPGVRIIANTTNFDAVIELQTAAGAPLAIENAVPGNGTEILNFYNEISPLVSGQTYFIAVRNANSAVSSGSFSVCVQRIRGTSCNSGAGPFQMCNNFKATWVGANSYGFTFTNTTTLAQTTLTSVNGVTQVPLGSLLPSFSYNVAISATYNLTDGAGNPEQIVINTPAACTITMAPHTNIELRSTDWCANGPKPLNGFVGANTWLCGAVNYQWRFRQTAPVEDVAFGAPIAGPPTSRFLNLVSALLISGATYDVEIRPVFAGNIPGNWSSTARCLQIIGPASAQEDNSGDQLLRNAEENGITAVLYPNPNNGERVSLSIEGATDMIQVRVLDATGREVNRTVWIATDSSNREIVFGQPLSPGIYVIELIADGVRSTERMIVQR